MGVGTSKPSETILRAVIGGRCSLQINVKTGRDLHNTAAVGFWFHLTGICTGRSNFLLKTLPQAFGAKN